MDLLKIVPLFLKDLVWSAENCLVLFLVQDNRVTDHRLKMNFELTSFLGGDIESAVQVNDTYKSHFFNNIASFPILPFFPLISTKYFVMVH